jgi:hypothetical protein
MSQYLGASKIQELPEMSFVGSKETTSLTTRTQSEYNSQDTILSLTMNTTASQEPRSSFRNLRAIIICFVWSQASESVHTWISRNGLHLKSPFLSLHKNNATAQRDNRIWCHGISVDNFVVTSSRAQEEIFKGSMVNYVFRSGIVGLVER